MMKNPCFAALLLGGLLFAPDTQASTQISGKPKVVFFATGSPGALDIEGVSDAVSLVDDGTNLTFTVPMDTVKSGIDLRDHHMNEKYVETGKFPNVTLVFPRAGLQWPVALKEAKSGTITAAFTAHGVTKDVQLGYDIRKSKTGYRVKAKFPFNAGDYGIAIPAYLGITVDPVMRAEASLDLTDAP